MKSKRLIFSLIIFISVFWFSIIVDATRFNPSATETDMVLDLQPASDITDGESASTGIAAFSDTSNATAFRGNKLFLFNEGLEDNGLATFSEDTGNDTRVTQAEVNLNTVDMPADASDTVVLSGAGDAAVMSGVGDTASAAIASVPTEVPVEEPSQYADIGISIAKDYVNIRAEANTESGVMGKLYRNSAAEILDTIGEWYYVESGGVKGYIRSDLLRTGIPDEELIENYGVLRISVGVDGLNVREDPDIESDKLTVIYQNERYPVVELHEEWVKVDIKDDRVIGYVKREMVEIIVDFADAVSKEEEQELLRLKAEERVKRETAVKYRDEVDYTDEELKLLACLVHSEAGNQSYEGKLAVANIVLNRIKSSIYPDTIKDVIYQPGQFSVAKSGSLAKQLANYDNYSSNSQLLSIKAARAALEGANNIGNRLYFHTYKLAVKKGYDSKQNCVKLQDHLFW